MSSCTLFSNAHIFTADSCCSSASALVVEGERIVWVGADGEVPPKVMEQVTSIVDLGGARVVPGFVDAHMHVVMLANFAPQISVMPPAITSIEELIAAVAARREEQGPDSWVQGWGYDEGLLTEKRSPTRWDLDRGCSDAPVCLIRSCGHIRCANSYALELAGIDRNTPDPVGGEIERDEHGEPTGVLKETARDLITPFIPKPSHNDAVQNIVDLGRMLSRAGVVAATDMCSVDGTNTTPLLRAAAEAGYKQDTGTYMLWDYVADDPTFTLTPEEHNRSQQVFTAGMKVLTDGSVSGRTAWFYEPFTEKPGDGAAPTCGMSTISDEALAAAIAFCQREKCQLSLHAMGTRAIDRALEALESAGAWSVEGASFARIEHVTAPSECAVEQFAQTHIPVVTQPIFPYAEIGTYKEQIGLERTRRCYPLRTLVDEGATVALSTDAPATSWADAFNPFPTIKSAVTRHAFDGTDFGCDEALSVEEALCAYTREAARVVGFEGLGMLRAGYKASFVVLDRDILSVPTDTIDQVQVAQTYIRGERVV